MCALMAGVLASFGAPALAVGDAVPTSTTEPATTTSTTLTGEVTPTTSPDPVPAPTPAPPASPPPTTPAPPPPGPGAEAPRAADPSPDVEMPTEEPPPESLAVPPPAVPAAPTVEQQQLEAAIAAGLQQGRLSLSVALGLQAQVGARVTAAAADVDAGRTKLEQRGADTRRARAELEAQRRRVRQWAVQAYTGGTLLPVAYVLESNDLNDIPRRLGLAGAAFGALDQSLGDHEDALSRAEDAYREARVTLTAAEERLATAQNGAAEATVQVTKRQQEVGGFDAGKAVSLGGVAFPVTGPTQFIDTFGAPRMTGTPFAHIHQGVDIFGPSGAPVVAFERGVVVRLGTDILGGTKLWLVGQSGARYYYAHLRSYAPGLAEGQVVDAGQTLALVGNTGNALNTPPHLHFEIHPGGGTAVDPYPVLVQIEAAARIGAAALRGQAASPPAGTVAGRG